MFGYKKLRLIIWSLTFLALAGCSTSLPVQQEFQDNFFGDEVFLTDIEYYFYFLGKSVPSHFKQVGRNLYGPEVPPRLGQEVISAGVKDGKIDMVFVFCIFDNRTDLWNWFWKYLEEAEKLGFEHGIDDESDIIFFARENYAFAFEDKSEIELFGGEFSFWKMDE